jgi:LAS superfamily LD-carboxypeptidase LdcB
MTSKYGLYNKIEFPSSADLARLGNKQFTYEAVKVLKVILNEDDPYWERWGGWDALGLIYFVPIYSNIRKSTSLTDVNVARPLFSNIKQYPLENEIVYILALPNPEINSPNTNASSFYYVNTVNIWNHPHHNVLPILPNNDTSITNYEEVSNGISKTQESNPDEFSFGETFKEKSNIKPLLPFEGDIIYEGRYGQSIRFGSTVTQRKDKNTWSNKGNDGDPITIIRNGQTGDKEGWIPTVENINTDSTSFYLCDGQVIPINVASLNLRSFSISIENKEVPVISFKENPTSTQTSPTEEDSFRTYEDKPSSFPQSATSSITSSAVSQPIQENNNDVTLYDMYINGKIVGKTEVSYINGVKVANLYKDKVIALIEAAAKDGVKIILRDGFRTFDEQQFLRERHLLPSLKSKYPQGSDGYKNIILNGSSNNFKPITGKPGFSNHQNGIAYDFVVTNSMFRWMKRNAKNYGFVRTVKSEKWHWEYRPSSSQYAFVPSNDPSWV